MAESRGPGRDAKRGVGGGKTPDPKQKSSKPAAGSGPMSPDGQVGTVSSDPGTTREDALGHRPRGSDGPQPTVTLRRVLSFWLCFHLFAILVSFTSVVEPSAIHARLATLFHPYLRPAHFSADDRPVYLAYGEMSERPHVLQVSTQLQSDLGSVDSNEWQQVGPERYPGLAVSDRIARWLSTAAMLSENDQPGLVAELLLPVVQRNPDVNAIRIVRLLTDLDDVNAEPESVYVANVVRSAESVSLVQLNAARLSSQVIDPDTVDDRRRGTGKAGGDAAESDSTTDDEGVEDE